MYVCVCACVCERERQIKREISKEIMSERRYTEVERGSKDKYNTEIILMHNILKGNI